MALRTGVYKSSLLGRSAAKALSGRGMSTYRAAVVTDLKKPVEIQEKQRESLGKGEVRVGVKAAGINFADILQSKGQYQVKLEPPFVPGFEAAGEVLEVGPGVKGFKPGDHVISLAPGAFAEEVVVPSRMVFPFMGKIKSFEKASALMVHYGTAHLALTRRAAVKENETVLVTAAAGGVGLATVQIAKKLGATVIAAAGGDAKLKVAQENGADHLIDYRQESIKDAIKKITDGKGVNVAVDMVGGDGFDQIVRSMAWEGRIVVIGFAAGGIPKIPANLLLVKNISALGLFWGAYAQNDPKVLVESAAKSVIPWFVNGDIDPHVSLASPLEDINDAFDYVTSRKSTGKVVLTM